MSWLRERLGSVAELAREGVDPRSVPAGTRYVGLEHIGSDGSFSDAADVNPSDLASTKFSFSEEHVLFGKLRPYLRKTVRPSFAGICSTDIIPIAPSARLDRNYLFHFLRTDEVVDRATSMASGANLPRISPRHLVEFEIPLPPLAEQQRIAAILDQADALRRKRLAALEKLDSLVAGVFRARFGEITQAGSRSVGAPFVAPLSSLLEIKSGSTPSRADTMAWGGEIPWVKTGELIGEEILDTQEKISAHGKKLARLDLYPKSTILLAMYGQGLTRGRVGQLGVPATTNQACAALIPNASVNMDFLFVQLKLAYERIRELGRGGNQPNLNLDLVRNIPVICPSLAEQEHFAAMAHRIRSQKQSAMVQHAGMQALFVSLQHRAFRGEL